MNDQPLLLDAVRRVSRQRDLSRKTENAYVNHIRRFQDFHAERDLRTIGTSGVYTFLNYLKKAENLAASTQNQALSALSFLYRNVFGQKTAFLKTFKRIKTACKPPAIFTPEEAHAVLSKMRGETFLVAALMYGAGLRLSEAVALRVGDVNFSRREITIRDPRTGRRERTTILPETIIRPLKRHLATVRYLYEDDCLLGYGKVSVPKQIATRYPNAASDWNWQFVFPSRVLNAGARHHLAESTVQKAVGEAILKAGVRRAACCQTFRHSFAARLFEANCDLRHIQTLLGHKNLKTTAFYERFTVRRNVLRSPLDR